MPSTSTGYHRTGIWKEQYSSGGGRERFSSGSALSMSVDSKIELESGSTLDVESGASLTIADGGMFRNENITTVISCGVYGTTVPAEGIVHLTPTSSGNITVQFSSIKGVGQTVTFLVANNTANKARIITGKTKCSIACSSIQMLAFSTDTIKRGYARQSITLTALSASRWAITNSISTAQGFLTFSSARAS